MSNKKRKGNLISIPLNNHIDLDRAVNENMIFDYKGQQFDLRTVTTERNSDIRSDLIDTVTIKLSRKK